MFSYILGEVIPPLYAINIIDNIDKVKNNIIKYTRMVFIYNYL